MQALSVSIIGIDWTTVASAAAVAFVVTCLVTLVITKFQQRAVTETGKKLIEAFMERDEKMRRQQTSEEEIEVLTLLINGLEQSLQEGNYNPIKDQYKMLEQSGKNAKIIAEFLGVTGFGNRIRWGLAEVSPITEGRKELQIYIEKTKLLRDKKIQQLEQ